MNKLERRILEEVGYTEETLGTMTYKEARMAQVAAKICLEVAEKGYRAGKEYERSGWRGKTFEDFKQEIL